MAFKRQTDRLPIIPANAKVHNVTCHYCIVGCGYKAYTWPINQQGSFTDNWSGADLSKQQSQDTANWYAPSMYNVVRQDGRPVHLVIKPDVDCVVNSGLGSVRGARMAENRRSDVTGTQQQRLTDPMVWRYGTWQPTTWDDALDLVARVTARVIDKDNEDDLYVSMFDHGGSAGGYENTWGTGKLYFESMKVKHCRIHNRPAYNSEVHSTRDMGVDELNYQYADYEMTDTIFLIGANPLETQTNLFLNHMVPGMRNGARVLVVDPRRTVSVNACEEVAGADNVMHLQINSGTDLALFNALFTHIADQGWVDADFIAASTFQGDVAVAEDAAHPSALGSFEAARTACKMSPAEAAAICGVTEADIVMAAEWIAKPKDDGSRRKCVTAYEKGIIWGNDNYVIQSALVSLALATHNVGRRGTGVCRMGGHQEGYTRPPYPGDKKIYIDQEVIKGRGLMYTLWGTNPFQTTLNAEQHRLALHKRTAIVNEAIAKARGANTEQLIDVIYNACKTKGGMFVVGINLYPTMIAEEAHMLLPAAHPGEANLTSMNGERRLRLSEKFMDPPGSAKADCLIAADIANTLKAMYQQQGKADMAARFDGFNWTSEEDAFNDGFRRAGRPGSPPIDSQGGDTGYLATYELLRKAGNNGVQLPIKEVKDGKLIGTEMLYADYKFDTKDGKAEFKPAPWNGLPKMVADQKAKHKFWINQGRANEVWQTAYHDQYNSFVRDRYPMAYLEMNPADASQLGIKAGDVIEVWNDFGSTYAMAYPMKSIKPGHTFMLFGYIKGVAGDVVTSWVDRNVVPYYKGTWASVQRVGSVEDWKQSISFKERRYS